jgi:transposase
LFGNLGDALQRLLEQHPAALRAAAQQQEDHTGVEKQTPVVIPAVVEATLETVKPAGDEAPLTQRDQRFRDVLSRHADGWNYSQIARALHINIRTVKRYILSGELPKRGAPLRMLTSSVTPYMTYLERRWQQGCQNKTQLWQEIVAQGYAGSRSSIYRALKGFRADRGPWTASPKVSHPKRRALSPRQGMWLLARPKEELDERERVACSVLESAHEDIRAASSLAQRFQEMLRQRDVAALEGWLEDASTSGIGAFKHFAASLRRDEAAVRAALEQPWSNGQLEAQVNRLKVIKRISYGRAKFDLLRRRVLYAAGNLHHQK